MTQELRLRHTILACTIAGITWATALLNTHAAAVRPTDHVQAYHPGLDESVIAGRPISYPVLENASVQSSQPLITFTSERGQLSARSVTVGTKIVDALRLLARFSSLQMSYPLSTQPVTTGGVVVWHGNQYGKTARFLTTTTDRKLVVTDDNSHVLWQLNAPVADYVLTVDAANRAQFVNRSGKVMWHGALAQQVAGYSLTGNNGCTKIRTGSLELTFDPYGLHLAADNRDGWSAPTFPNFVFLRIKAPNLQRILAIENRGSEPPVYIAWEPGLSIRSAISIRRGTVTIGDSRHRHSTTQYVDLGTMERTGLKPPTATFDIGPLVTPIAPYYINAAPMTASYQGLDGSAVAEETVEYRASPSTNSARVTRTLVSHLRRGTSSIMTTYSAPVNPATSKWAP